MKTSEMMLSAEKIARVFALIERWTGHALRGSAPGRLMEFLQTRATALGLHSAEEYLQRLERSSAHSEEIQQIINVVTNGLTAFWRDEPQLEALRSIMDHTRGRKLAIWCAGCATGEEPLTVAMLADELGAEVEILGTDVNTEFLQQAQDPVFSQWSVRRMDERLISRHFTPGEDGKFRINDSLRTAVDWRYHNLLDHAPRPTTRRLWDVILCRNVLIYFSDTMRAHVLKRFSQVLSPDGYLLLGSSEVLEEDELFRASRQSSGFVYRKQEKRAGDSISLNVENLLSDDLVVQTTLEEETQDFDAESAVLGLIRHGLDHRRSGRDEAALACWEAALGYDPFVVEAHILMADLLSSHRSFAQARTCWQKVLFLQPDVWWAWLCLAQISLLEGDLDEARRHHVEAVRMQEHASQERTYERLGALGVRTTMDGGVPALGGLGVLHLALEIQKE